MPEYIISLRCTCTGSERDISTPTRINTSQTLKELEVTIPLDLAVQSYLPHILEGLNPFGGVRHKIIYQGYLLSNPTKSFRREIAINTPKRDNRRSE